MSAGLIWTLSGAGLIGAGIGALRQAWVQHRRLVALLWTGWLALLAGSVCLVLAWGGERGSAFACLLLGLIAYAIIGVTAQRRRVRTRAARDAVMVDPEERPSNWLRTTAKALLAMAIAGVAAMGLGIVFAAHAPISEVDRVVIGGLLVPLLWGAGIAWTLCEARLLRGFAFLTGISVLAYGAIFLPPLIS